MTEHIKSYWLIVAVLASFLLIFCNEFYNYNTTTAKYYGNTRAVVKRIWETSPNLKVNIWAEYVYSVNNALYTNTEKISIGLNTRPFIKENDTISILYSEMDPSKVTAIHKSDFISTFIVLGLVILSMLYIILNRKA